MNNSEFLIGAATAAHQVEGNNTNSDIWALEHMKYGGYPEKSGAAANHYRTYREDIARMAEAGLNAYRFSLEWARIEPREGVFDAEATEHYRDVILACREAGVEPIVTLHHFSSPKWLIERGGWESEYAVEAFERYTRYVCEQYGDLLHYVCTLNEANMGVLIAIFIRQAMEERAKREGEEGAALQVGVDIEAMAAENAAKLEENRAVFGVDDPAVFVSPRTATGIEVVKRAHMRAVDAVHKLVPGAKAGMTLSLRDIQSAPGGEDRAEAAWAEEFGQFVPAMAHDDFFGVQNYTRTVFGPDGELPPAQGAELTQMGYEFYPQGLEHVIRRVHEAFPGQLVVTENGIATADDTRRVAYIDSALAGVRACVDDGIDVAGYMYWSLIDNYEWQSGYAMQFGLMDRNEDHSPKPSLAHLGSLCRVWNESEE
ncbi:MAG: glycoside hydrolase family 1 protein [Atopobiaceae bacterium]|nr:glycoside hydrolase family 1 protein [Atopobiaceae bacterium]